MKARGSVHPGVYNILPKSYKYTRKVVLLGLRLLLLTTVNKYPFSYGLYHYVRLMLELVPSNLFRLVKLSSST